MSSPTNHSGAHSDDNEKHEGIGFGADLPRDSDEDIDKQIKERNSNFPNALEH